MIFLSLTPGISLWVVNRAAAAPARKEPSFWAKTMDCTLGAFTAPSMTPNFTLGNSAACFFTSSAIWVLAPTMRS